MRTLLALLGAFVLALPFGPVAAAQPVPELEELPSLSQDRLVLRAYLVEREESDDARAQAPESPRIWIEATNVGALPVTIAPGQFLRLDGTSRRGRGAWSGRLEPGEVGRWPLEFERPSGLTTMDPILLYTAGTEFTVVEFVSSADCDPILALLDLHLNRPAPVTREYAHWRRCEFAGGALAPYLRELAIDLDDRDEELFLVLVCVHAGSTPLGPLSQDSFVLTVGGRSYRPTPHPELPGSLVPGTADSKSDRVGLLAFRIAAVDRLVDLDRATLRVTVPDAGGSREIEAERGADYRDGRRQQFEVPACLRFGCGTMMPGPGDPGVRGWPR